ncbi:2-dehydropantoate 2-reductase [Rhizoctonia solani]|uniref:2-dehydropantoate 2-reductase n=1 Tax=Rhizoctonia solani TaxID=456999 RepID=A0A8H8NPM6_9AGAM|nr:2-dehydropantoate 2-reductase [Rhizoctonia solani]QRW16398.1 2-dehydropantoate 2-reductase [Rhizoctonia solani]
MSAPVKELSIPSLWKGRGSSHGCVSFKLFANARAWDRHLLRKTKPGGELFGLATPSNVDSAASAEDRYDYIVCTFKCLPDVVTTPKLLGPLLARSRNFVLIQNGIGIELDLQAAVPSGIVMSGCAWIDATVIDHGRTLKHGPIEKLVVGVHPPLGAPSGTPHSTEAHTALTTFVDLLKAGGGTPEQVVDIQAARWKKIIWNAGFSTFATLANATLPDICHEPARSYTMPIVRGFMEEVVSVARGLGLDESVLPVASIDEAIDLTLSEYGVTGPAYKASMLVDFLAERPMEIEVIIGGILRYAVAKQVPAPRFAIPAFIQRPMFHLNFAFRLSTAYALLKVHQTRFIQKSKSRA